MANGKLRKLLMQSGIILAALTMVVFFNNPSAKAIGAYLGDIPDGFEQSCNLCHDASMGINDFGNEFMANDNSFAGLGGISEEPAAEADAEEALADDQEKQDSQIELILPSNAIRGDRTQLEAKVTVDGSPVSGKKVEFFEHVDLFINGKKSLGEATTDDQGVAAISYWPRATEENVEITASVAGGAQINSSESSGYMSLTVTGPLVEPFEGVTIPFLGPWVVALLVGAIWASFGYAVYNTLQIPKLGRGVAEQELAPEEEERHTA